MKKHNKRKIVYVMQKQTICKNHFGQKFIDYLVPNISTQVNTIKLEI